MLMQVLEKLFNLFVFPGFLFMAIIGLYFVGIHRKIVARIQRRIGPPIDQPFKDFAKLMIKEDVTPEGAAKGLFSVAPYITIIGVVIGMMFIPVGMAQAPLDTAGAFLILLYLITAAAVGVMVAGSASSSPYAAVGVSREMALVIAYDLSLIIVFLTVAIKAATIEAVAGNGATDLLNYSINSIVAAQATRPFILDWTMIPAFLAFLMIIPANLGLPPFDVVEAETEIVEGPMIEFSGSRLALLQLGSAMKAFFVCSVIVVFFFPGGITAASGVLGTITNIIWHIFKAWLVYFFAGTLVSASLGRRRIDQAVNFYLTVPLVLSIISLGLVLAKIG